MMNMTVSGVEKYVSRCMAASVATEVMQPSALKKSGLLVERRAKQIVKQKNIIDTSNLFNNINTHDPVHESATEASIEIVSEVEYSIFNEYGTSQMAARPYMRPALDETKPEIEKLLGEAFAAATFGAMGAGGKLGSWTKTVR